MDPRILKSINKLKVLTGEKPITLEENAKDDERQMKLQIDKIFEPRSISAEVFNVLYPTGIWETVTWAGLIKSNKKIRCVHDLLLEKIYLFSSEWISERATPIWDKRHEHESLKIDKIPDEVFKMHDELKVYLKRDIRLQNFYFYFGIVAAYLIFLSISAGSIKPDDLWRELRSHVGVVLFFLKFVVRTLVFFGSIFIGGKIYGYFQEKIIGDESHLQSESRSGHSFIAIIAGVIAFALALLIMVNGVNTTFRTNILKEVAELKSAD